ncbi:MAG: ABC transporter substrate-binding protein [Prevotella sp.]|nr:ABC transporter substrate-binding protein [Prevotella sp.]
MNRLLKCFLLAVLLLSTALAYSQTMKTHKVKKKETIYGIARENGISVDQLIKANPGMEALDYNLKKGDVINIPAPIEQPTITLTPEPKVAEPTVDSRSDLRRRALRVGVMLPLHSQNNDGRRMVEYYRGILMACDSLKRLGVSIDVHAWNLAEDGDVRPLLLNDAAAKCDLIIGPLYSKFVPQLSKFVTQYNSRLLIPFSIRANDELASNPRIFQVYQSPSQQLDLTARRCADYFRGRHFVIVDCADTASTKGYFTSSLRRHLEQAGSHYSLTSLQSTDTNFANAFSRTEQNMVVLNSARSQDLLAVFGKLSTVVANNPDVQVALFGYTEWLTYANRHLSNFYKYDVYVPAPFFYNQSSEKIQHLQRLYRQNFSQDMLSTQPRFALTGFDHAMFFFQGLHRDGITFKGDSQRPYVQTPLKFKRVGDGGGYQNSAYMFIHYKNDRTIETVNY